MLYLLVIFIIVFAVVCVSKIRGLYYCPIDVWENKKWKRYLYLEIILFVLVLVFFIVSTIAGTIFTSCSDFLSVTTGETSNTYQVTDFSAEHSTYNLIGNYETKYSITIEDNLLIEIISQDFGTKIICDNYNPKTVKIEESHYFKWWFLCPYDTYTYTLS